MLTYMYMWHGLYVGLYSLYIILNNDSYSLIFIMDCLQNITWEDGSY